MLPAIIVIVGLIIVLTVLSWVFSNKILKPKVADYDMLYGREVEEGRLKVDLYHSWEKEDFKLKSRYGYNLSCQLLNNSLSKKQFKEQKGRIKIAILCHGYTCGKYSSMMYAELFLNRGITVLTYDHRNHGLSGKAFTTMGYYEKFDLQTVIDWCYSEYGPEILLVTHGESMGAATVLSLPAIDGRVRCTIADCGYSSLDELVKYQLGHNFHMPPFPIYYTARLLIKLRAGFWIEDVKPIDSVRGCNGAILFIHGEEDKYVPLSMSYDMFEAKADKKELYVAANARHAQSCQLNRQEYEKRLNAFLDKYYFDTNL